MIETSLEPSLSFSPYQKGSVLARSHTVAIDGPVASGKTALGRALSKELNYRFLDTGIMYRSITWLALRQGIDTGDGEALCRLAEATSILPNDQEDGWVILNGQELGPELRETSVDEAVSLVSQVSGVRSALVAQQRQIAKDGKIIVVGRDVGTVVLPGADLKLYLVASVQVRARRRFLELESQGHEADYHRVLQGLQARDEMDSGRSISPLRPAPDSVVLDTENIGLQGVIEKALGLIINIQ